MNPFVPFSSRSAELLLLAPVAAIVLTACGGGSEAIQAGAPFIQGATAPSATEGSEGSYYIDTSTGDLYGPKTSTGWPAKPAMNLVGKPGANGVSGTNGSTVLSGSAAPAAATGAVGDFYLDTTNSTMYGPKTAAGWPMGVSLKGINGVNGNTILTGTTAPAAATGNNGDLYLNTTNSSIYGPKTAAGWGNAVSLIGQTGAAGTNGKTLLNGITDPAAGTGVEGDFYINTQAKTLWGPKGASAWPTLSVSMQGTTGATGAKGDTGATGAAGKTILNGTSNPTASDGADGDFFIQTTSKTLFGPKTATGWGSGFGLVGATGAKGDTGNTGATGARGNSVLNGTANPGDSDGVQGDFYINTTSKTLFGPKGASWPNSGVSMEGTTGAQGAQGVAGKTILSGDTLPPANLGNDGDFYIRTSDTTLHGPKAGGAWPPTTLSLKGAKGDTGTNGTNGNKIWANSTAPTHNASGVSTAPAGALSGDLYIQTGSSPKLFTLSATGWDAGVSLGGGSSSGGAVLSVYATGQTQTISASNGTATELTKYTWNTPTVNNDDLSLDSAGSTFTVSKAGIYAVEMRTVGLSTGAACVPVLVINNPSITGSWQDNTIWGVFYNQSSFTTPYRGWGVVASTLALSLNDKITTAAYSSTNTLGCSPTSSNIKFVRLN